MAFASSPDRVPPNVTSAKIVVAGGFGVWCSRKSSSATISASYRSPTAVAVRAGVDLDAALRCLGLLAAAGFIERCELGWRAVKLR